MLVRCAFSTFVPLRKGREMRYDGTSHLIIAFRCTRFVCSSSNKVRSPYTMFSRSPSMTNPGSPWTQRIVVLSHLEPRVAVNEVTRTLSALAPVLSQMVSSHIFVLGQHWKGAFSDSCLACFCCPINMHQGETR